MRSYTITFATFDPHKVTARTAGAARYKSFLALREAGYRLTFRDFLRHAVTLHHGPTTEPRHDP